MTTLGCYDTLWSSVVRRTENSLFLRVINILYRGFVFHNTLSRYQIIPPNSLSDYTPEMQLNTTAV